MKKQLRSMVVAAALLMAVCYVSNAVAQGFWEVEQITSNNLNDMRPRLDAGQVYSWQELTPSVPDINNPDRSGGWVYLNGAPAPIIGNGQIAKDQFDARDGILAHVVKEAYPSTTPTKFFVNNVLTTTGISLASAERGDPGLYFRDVKIRGDAWVDAIKQEDGDTTFGLVRSNGSYTPLYSFAPPFDDYFFEGTRCIGFRSGQAIYWSLWYDEGDWPHSRLYYEDGSRVGPSWPFSRMNSVDFDDDLIVLEKDDYLFASSFNILTGQVELLESNPSPQYGSLSPVTRNGNIAWIEFEAVDDYLVAKIGGVITSRLLIEGDWRDLDIEGNTVVWSESKIWPPQPGTFEIYRATWHGPNAADPTWNLYE